MLNGGGKRDRTADLLHAMQALYQLSYTPTVCSELLLNRLRILPELPNFARPDSIFAENERKYGFQLV